MEHNMKHDQTGRWKAGGKARLEVYVDKHYVQRRATETKKNITLCLRP